MSAFTDGYAAEEQAARFLQNQGYQILARRYKTRFGELDLVCLLGDQLVCVEVKKRATFALGMYALAPRQQKRLVHAMQHYIQHHSIVWQTARVDLFVLNRHGQIRHIPNVIMLEEMDCF